MHERLDPVASAGRLTTTWSQGSQLRRTAIGLTACRGDGWRDTVKKPTRPCSFLVCGGPDGPRDPANHLPGRVSRLRADPSAPQPRPQSRTRHYAVPDGRTGRSCSGVSRRPYGTHLVQLLSTPVLSTVRLSPD